MTFSTRASQSSSAEALSVHAQLAKQPPNGHLSTDWLTREVSLFHGLAHTRGFWVRRSTHGRITPSYSSIPAVRTCQSFPWPVTPRAVQSSLPGPVFNHQQRVNPSQRGTFKPVTHFSPLWNYCKEHLARSPNNCTVKAFLAISTCKAKR